MIDWDTILDEALAESNGEPTGATSDTGHDRNGCWPAAGVDYFNRGWQPCAVKARSKQPAMGRGWQRFRFTSDTIQNLARAYAGRHCNIGVLLGEPSGGLIDVDLDHPAAVELAPQFLPPTGAKFGRPGKPCSHFLYRSPEASTIKHKARSGDMLVELRSTGGQTVFPPSTHPSGERVAWAEDGVPATVEADELAAAVERLADAVRKQLGEKPKRSKGRQQAPLPEHDRLVAAARAYVRKVPSASQGGRDDAAFNLAGHLVAFETDASGDKLTEAEIVELVGQWAAGCSPPLTADDVRRVVASALKGNGSPREPHVVKIKRGKGTGKQRTSEKPEASEADPADEAREFLKQHRADGVLTLRLWRGEFHLWQDDAYRSLDDKEFKARLINYLNKFYCKVTRYAVGNILAQVEAQSILAYATEPPAWIGETDTCLDWAPADVLVTRSCLVHLPSLVDGRDDAEIHLTPRFFSQYALPFEFSLDAPPPTGWLAFLESLWPGERGAASIALLQEWFGYCLTPDTSQQKILLILGPKRSGKGTIGRVLRALIGPHNVAGPTLASLATNFGLWPLLGKSAAIVSDARLSGRIDSHLVVERLLSISGEDALTCDRKKLPAVTTKLNSRFLILSNEMPKLYDASGAMASRMIPLQLARSWYGKEDTELTAKLLTELPSILLWAVAGWQRLRQRGYFELPKGARAIVGEIESLGSPVAEFVREKCSVGRDHSITCSSLYESYADWARTKGKRKIADAQTFARDLRAVRPEVRTKQRRVGNGERVRQFVGITTKGIF